MNGGHDLGGVRGLGPIAPEADEPVFHADWERRAFALTLAMGLTGSWTLDAARLARESLPPERYLAMSYYEIWLAGLERLLVERGLVTPDELDRGRSSTPPRSLARRPGAADIPALLAEGGPAARPSAAPPGFALGDKVRTRNLDPETHTRLPRYLRDKPGEIIAAHGAHVFPDTNAHGLGENPQWLYTVRFAAADVWGRVEPEAVCADLWEPYLLPISSPIGEREMAQPSAARPGKDSSSQ